MRTLALVLLLLIGGVQAQEAKWKTYVNPRFGFSLEYPTELIGSREPENGAGREFHTKDEEFSILAHAHFLGAVDESESLESVWKEALKELGSTVTYKKKGKDWYVVSGVKPDGTEYYYKWWVKGKNWAELRITYPHAKNKKYDPWVERIAKRFVPFLEGDFDRSK
jgi:hypothetical protein